MTKTKKRTHRNSLFVCLLAAALILSFGLPAAANADEQASVAPAILESTPRHRQVARMVTRFVERAHYARARVDDELSAAILDDYLRSLDPGKHYFLASDIVYFSRYRAGLDDVLRSGELGAVFDVFRLYRLRAQQNLSFAIATLDEEPNFTVDEVYFFDREDLPWIRDPARNAGSLAAPGQK